MHCAQVRGQLGRFWSPWPLYEFRDLNIHLKRGNRNLDLVSQWGGQHLFLNDDIFKCLQVRLLKSILLNIHPCKLCFDYLYTLYPTHQFFPFYHFSLPTFYSPCHQSLSEYELSPFIAVWIYKAMGQSTRVLIALGGRHFWRKLTLPPEHPSDINSSS